MSINLNIGCGPTRIDGEIGIDRYTTKSADVVADMRYLPFPDNSIDFIRCDHVLEHQPVRDVLQVLMESYRCLKSEGTLRIGVPDLTETFIDFLETKELIRKVQILRNIYGSETHPGEYHKSGFDEQILRNLLETVGFEDILIEPDYARPEGKCLQAFGNKP